jgi:hypothetical protein
MLLMLHEIRTKIPFDLPETTICGGDCRGCSKKMLELLDTEVGYWESVIEWQQPSLADLNNLQQLALRTFKILQRNKLV